MNFIELLAFAVLLGLLSNTLHHSTYSSLTNWGKMISTHRQQRAEQQELQCTASTKSPIIRRCKTLNKNSGFTKYFYSTLPKAHNSRL